MVARPAFSDFPSAAYCHRKINSADARIIFAMTDFQTFELQKSIRTYFEAIPWQSPVAATLTLKQRIKQQKIDPYIATSNFRHFLNRLNRQVFGNASKRLGRGLRVIPILEHDELVRFHNHAVIDRPQHVTFQDFKVQIECCWSKTTWGYQESVIVPMTSPGWIRYITKTDQKPEFDLAIDWTNTRVD